MTDERKRVVQRGYDRMADRYASWSHETDDPMRERMVDAFASSLQAGAKVLDLGCGSGLPSTRLLAQRFDVLGVDASAAQIERARANVPEAQFIVADYTTLDLVADSFNGVVALYSVSHVPRDDHGTLFECVHRWLRPGGLFLATLGATDAPDWTGPWLGEEMFFSSHDADTNRRLIRNAGFEIVVDELAITAEPDGDVSFLWVMARKPRG